MKWHGCFKTKTREHNTEFPLLLLSLAKGTCTAPFFFNNFPAAVGRPRVAAPPPEKLKPPLFLNFLQFLKPISFLCSIFKTFFQDHQRQGTDLTF
jgi:hypothetical protein